jgi:RNA polymerase subunit RPABC4/transcription elongation factor Spt4
MLDLVFQAKPWGDVPFPATRITGLYLARELRIFALSAFIKIATVIWEKNGVAAFCACCGAVITLKAEACPVCGTPRHGMAQPDLLLTLDFDTTPSQENVRVDRNLSKPSSSKRL